MVIMGNKKKIFLLIGLCAGLVLAAGLTSDLSLGDEVYHWRLAKDIFNTGHRPAFDSAYGTGQPPGYFYNSEPLWHAGLALFWKITGGISAVAAQSYQVLYYILLLAATYLLATELYGSVCGFYATLITATIPAVAVFSMLFYLDIPATALSVFCFLLIVKRKVFLAGIVLALMYLTKRNVIFLAPALFFISLYLNRTTLWKRTLGCIALFVPLLVAIPLDVLWRENHLRLKLIFQGKEIVGATAGTVEGFKNRVFTKEWSIKTTEYLNSHLLNGHDVAKYFGFLLLIVLVLYIVRRRGQKKDIILWGPILSYFFFFCFFFNPSSDIRFLIPIMPLLAILGAKAMDYKKGVNKWLKLCIYLFCAAQFIGALWVTRMARTVSPQLNEAFSFISANTPENAIFVYPEYIILEKTNRRFVWVGNMPGIFAALFWGENDAYVHDVLTGNGIDYIVIKKARVYDDTLVKHYGGYPRSFVDRLFTVPYLSKVFDNPAVSIWKIQK
jgi:4-amino-4-deoxy-L-arabinose transferase-like glycosyltransferase